MAINLLKPKQLAATLGINENTLAKWRLSGVGPKYIKVQRHIRYSEYDVREWLNERKFHSTTEADHNALKWNLSV